MPSFDHEILVDLFRENAVLAAELLRSCAGIDIDIDHARADHGSIDLSQVVSTEDRADNVAILRGPDGLPVTSVIVEVQLREDRDKLQSWSVYVAALRARLGCPTMLLVIAPEPAIARWAPAAADAMASAVGSWSASYTASAISCARAMHLARSSTEPAGPVGATASARRPRPVLRRASRWPAAGTTPADRQCIAGRAEATAVAATAADRAVPIG